MGFLDKLFGRKGAATPAAESAVDVQCPHAALTPRWDSAADMGKTELVSSYVCESCHESFSRDQGAGLVTAAADRLRVADDARRDERAAQ